MPYGMILTPSIIQIDSWVLANEKSTNGLLPFSFNLVFSGKNLNGQIFLDEDLKLPEVYESCVGSPIDEDHRQDFAGIIGEIVRAQYIPPGFSGRSCIKCFGHIFEDIYPDVAMKARRGAGRWAAISMEAIPNPLERAGQSLILHKPKFFGAGLVRLPGEPEAKIVEIDGKPGKSYSEIKEDFQIPGLSNLDKQAASLKSVIQNGLRIIGAEDNRNYQVGKGPVSSENLRWFDANGNWFGV